MQIDMEMIEALVAAGATGAVVLAFLKLSTHRAGRVQATEKPSIEVFDKIEKLKGRKHGSKAQAVPATDTKPPKDEGRSNAVAKPGDPSDSQAVDDTPVARLFREGAESLVALGVGDRTARQLIGKWRKLTGDDCQLISAAINKAVELQVHDPAPWVLATLKSKVNNGQQSNGFKRKSLSDAADDLIARAEGRDRQITLDISDYTYGGVEVGERPGG